MTIDLWTVDVADWGDLAGVLALQLQLAYSLSRVGAFREHSYIRVMAPVMEGALTEQAQAELESKLRRPVVLRCCSVHQRFLWVLNIESR